MYSLYFRGYCSFIHYQRILYKNKADIVFLGKKEKYCYMVMTLFGHALARLFKFCKREFTPSTQVRLGLQMLYGLKQLHDVGYVFQLYFFDIL